LVLVVLVGLATLKAAVMLGTELTVHLHLALLLVVVGLETTETQLEVMALQAGLVVAPVYQTRVVVFLAALQRLVKVTLAAVPPEPLDHPAEAVVALARQALAEIPLDKAGMVQLG
jgi:hypothetical protein